MEFCWRVESTTGRVMEDSEWHHHCGGECTGEGRDRLGENGSILPKAEGEGVSQIKGAPTEADALPNAEMPGVVVCELG